MFVVAKPAHRIGVLIVRCRFVPRYYATRADGDGEIDHHKRMNLHPWPNKRNPSPYEIFDLSDGDMSLSQLEMNKLLKKKYVSYVKLYHPDLSKNLQIYHKGSLLSENIKRQRFDQVQEAYDILKDPRRRVAFRRYTTNNWDEAPRYNQNTAPFSKQNYEAYRRAQGHRSSKSFKADEEFWLAGTWEDYYKMKYNRAPPTKEELEKNKYKILAGVLLVALLAFSLQIMLALDRTNEYLLQSRLTNLQVMEDLQHSTDNYGDGLQPLDRMRRFLISRRSTLLMKEKGDIVDDTDLKNQDDELLIKYAQKVEK